MEMLAAQAAHQATPGLDHEDTILANEKLSEAEKKDTLQKTLNMAASNGDVERVTRLLSGNAKAMIDINALDEDGTPPLIYASCFVRRLHNIAAPTERTRNADRSLNHNTGP